MLSTVEYQLSKHVGTELYSVSLKLGKAHVYHTRIEWIFTHITTVSQSYM